MRTEGSVQPLLKQLYVEIHAPTNTLPQIQSSFFCRSYTISFSANSEVGRRIFLSRLLFLIVFDCLS